MLDTAEASIRAAGKHLKLSDEEVDYILAANKEHIFDITLDSGKKFPAYRVQHNNVRGPYKGGIRFHPEVNIDEVRALATLMSLKTAAVGLPLGGGKGGITVDPRSLSEAELEELARKYVQKLHEHIGPDKDVPAPDVNTNPKIIDWMVDEFEKLTGDGTGAAFTGKSVKKGGSAGRDAATGRGGMIVLRELLKAAGKEKADVTYAVQGFGNVGSFFGTHAEGEQKNWILTAGTDSSGGVSDPFGLSAKELDAFKQNGQKLVDFSTDGVIISNEDIVREDVDVLVLAALGDVITKENVDQVRAKYILELANGPVNSEAYDLLTANGIIVVPDILANAGGVVVSYLEWLQNKSGERWTKEDVFAKLETYMVQATEDVLDYAKEHKLSLKEAAMALAINRILEARRI